MVAGVELRSLPLSTPAPVTPTAPLLLDQEALPVILPAGVLSVLVPYAVSCSVPPSGTLADDGVIDIEASCSGGKKPLQLTANAKAASAAQAPINRSLDFVEDMVLKDSLGARRTNCVFLPAPFEKL